MTRKICMQAADRAALDLAKQHLHAAIGLLDALGLDIAAVHAQSCLDQVELADEPKAEPSFGQR